MKGKCEAWAINLAGFLKSIKFVLILFRQAYFDTVINL